jgi:hypothetical protein
MALSEADAQARALAEVQAYCGWHIAPSETETITVDGSGSNVQPLPTLRMTDLLSLSVDGLPVDLTQIEWSEAGFIRCDVAQTDRLRGVVVEITHGYDAMPLDVQAVVDRFASRLIESDQMSTMLAQVGQVRVALGRDGLPASAALTELDRLVLDRYRLPPRA